MKTTTRVQIPLRATSLARLQRLAELTEAASHAEVVRRALEFHELTLAAEAQGRWLTTAAGPSASRPAEAALMRVADRAATTEQAGAALLQFELPAGSVARLRRLKAQTEAASYGEVVRTALKIYAFAAEAVAAGQQLQLAAANGDIATLAFPPLLGLHREPRPSSRRLAPAP